MLWLVLSSRYRYAFTGLVFEIWHLFKNCEVCVVANTLQENLFFKIIFKIEILPSHLQFSESYNNVAVTGLHVVQLRNPNSQLKIFDSFLHRLPAKRIIAVL
jgi:hypothetical protein